MTTNVVNLDALIPREDFRVEAQTSQATNIDKISLPHLEGPFFGPDLRKPDFQRETTHWSPNKVADLVRAFVDLDLIPAVILWRAGRYVFVIDGAHRLSALLAWIYDDYGDRKRSLDFFGGYITDEQRRVADRTRKLVNKSVGPYADYLAARGNPLGAKPEIQDRLSNISVNSIVAQWVPATDPTSAEESFFKINQAATPIDPTERRLLRARKSASAIAARAITHAGTGHRYWSPFSKEIRDEIELLGKQIYHSLYEPPMAGNVVTTLDVPVAGRGYNALPFVFDLVNQVNGVVVADTTSKKKEVQDRLPDDTDGTVTVKFLRSIKSTLEMVTGDSPRSLGVHPVVYFYTRSGMFQPTAFLATLKFLDDLSRRGQLKEFHRVRRGFEDFLIARKEAISLLIHKFGSGERSQKWIHEYYVRVFKALMTGKSAEQIQSEFSGDPDFAFLTVPRPSGARPDRSTSKGRFNSGTKTAAFLSAALPNGTRCQICGSLTHRNSIHIDHKQPVREGGMADVSNAQVTHPYCDSSKG